MPTSLPALTKACTVRAHTHSHPFPQPADTNLRNAPDVVPTLCEGLLYEKDKDIVGLILTALGMCMLSPPSLPPFNTTSFLFLFLFCTGALLLPGSAVASACCERAKRCFLGDTLGVVTSSNPTTAAIVSALKAALVA